MGTQHTDARTRRTSRPPLTASDLHPFASTNGWPTPRTGFPSDWIELYNSAGASPSRLRGCLPRHHQPPCISIHFALLHRPPFGFVQFFADEGVGAGSHLDFKLPGCSAAFHHRYTTTTAAEVNSCHLHRTRSRGSPADACPDGAANGGEFPRQRPAPAPRNYVPTPGLARCSTRCSRATRAAVTNGNATPDFIELFNGGASPFNLAGYQPQCELPGSPGRIRASRPRPASVPAGGYLVIWCDGSRRRLDSTLGRPQHRPNHVDGESGGAYLFNTSGPDRQLDRIWIPGGQSRPIGFVVRGNGPVLASPTRQAGSTPPTATLANPNSVLRLNEWMARPARWRR